MKNKLKVGELRLHRDGYGFVSTGLAEEEDIFVPARFVGDALHTDLVEVRLIEGRRGKSEGRITKVIERRVKHLVGRLEQAGRSWRVIADDLRVRKQIKIPDDRLGGAKHGQNVVIGIMRYPKADKPMVGEVIRILGNRGDLDTEKQAVIVHHQLSLDFPKQVNEEADACFNKAHSGNSKDRRDLRNLNFVTIDGETARDFDDAIAVEFVDGDNIRLWVSIADVSHFVAAGSKLDIEALRRGTSVYFPDDCLPMLPEQLSNDLCSLKPKVDRYSMTVEMDVDIHGEVVSHDIYPSVIRSRERMTYAAIKKILVEKEASALEQYKDLVADFRLMEICFDRLHKRRLDRGSIDFDLPEPEIMIDMTGGIEGVVKADRHVGHMMIEEFMVAANECVARFLARSGHGCIYRVHDRPNDKKLFELSLLLTNLGYDVKIGQHAPPKRLAHVLEKVRSSPEERLINTSLLRAMSQAVYSEKNIGHYGLASKCYCHFTSPIRRYPDLVVHRLLKTALKIRQEQEASRRKSKSFSLKEIAEHCSRRERVAMDAERETQKLYLSYFMCDRIGESFEGVISHVTKFGFFVELKEYFVEGVVRLDSLPIDKYTFNEKGYSIDGKKTKKSYRIGDPVRVVVEEVDVPKREINFSLM